MSSRRTEAPTPRRLRKARSEGDVACSRDLSGAAALLAGMAALVATGPRIARLLTNGVATGLSGAFLDAGPWPAARASLALLARAAAPPCLAAAVAAAIAGAIQTGGLFSPSALRLRWDRLHPGRGFARLLSTDGARRAAGALVRLCVVLAMAGWVARTAAADAARAPRLGAPVLLGLAARIASGLAFPLGATWVALGTVDLALARRRRTLRLRMTRHEVVREHREDGGDPRRRAERRRLHLALASTAPLRRATCLVVNPTHVAVALEHRAGSDDAPVVVAKGTGATAARLRREARRIGLPVVQDVALARALFRLADVGEEIPAELFDAAAAVLVHVHARTAEEPSP